MRLYSEEVTQYHYLRPRWSRVGVSHRSSYF